MLLEEDGKYVQRPRGINCIQWTVERSVWLEGAVGGVCVWREW